VRGLKNNSKNFKKMGLFFRGFLSLRVLRLETTQQRNTPGGGGVLTPPSTIVSEWCAVMGWHSDAGRNERPGAIT